LLSLLPLVCPCSGRLLMCQLQLWVPAAAATAVAALFAVAVRAGLGEAMLTQGPSVARRDCCCLCQSSCGKWSGGPRLSRLLALGEGGRRGVGGCGGGGGCGVRRTMAAALPVAPPPGVEGVDDGNGNATTGGPRVWRLRAAAGDGREAGACADPCACWRAWV